MPAEFNWPIRVYYEDTDAAGIVFYANYLRYMERARTEWLRSIGYEHALLKNRHGILFAVKNVGIEYIKPAHLDELLTVSSILTKTRGASLVFLQTIKNNKDELLTRATVKVACLNASTLKASAMPEELLMEFAKNDR